MMEQPRSKKTPTTRKSLTIELKKEIIRMKDKGARLTDLALQFGVNKSTIAGILTNRQSIMGARVAKGVSRIYSPMQRKPVSDEMERRLLRWQESILVFGSEKHIFPLSL